MNGRGAGTKEPQQEHKPNQKQKEKMKREMLRDWLILGIVSLAAVILLLIFPARTEPVTRTAWEYLIELLLVLPAIMIILGLFSVWVPKEAISKYLGKASGIRGVSLAILFGALPTGPLYVAFPIAAALLKKGARRSNIIIFLSSWACIKLPQELVELQFLGVQFMALRLVLTIVFVIVMGLMIERLVEWSEGKGIVQNT